MHYDVPRGDRESAVWPDLAALPLLVDRNITARRKRCFHVLDVPAGDFASMCRADIARAADRFAGETGIEPVDISRAPVIATGHQPELVHAGVWIKNFLASRLAMATGGSSLNLIVDNDVPRHLGIVMPVKDDGRARRVDIDFARGIPEKSFEEYPPAIEDFEGLARSVSEAAAGMPFEDGARELVERIGRARSRGQSLGDALALVRIECERELGALNAEAPVSRVASTASFGLFVASIAADAERFAAFYNAALGDYRRKHGIRSRANPLPDLAFDGSRVEVPFWMWRAGQRRERLFVRRDGEAVELCCPAGCAGRLAVGSASDARASWDVLIKSGLKVRPRALSTTIFMRLFASDLFIHGIGGAKYDEVTDAIIRAFYEVEPPGYATISATLMIPWELEPVSPSEAGALAGRLRDIEYNPQRHLGSDLRRRERLRALINEKWRLVESRPDGHESRRAAWERIRAINGALAEPLAETRRETEQRLQDIESRLHDDDVLFSREYSVFLVGARRAADFYADVLSPLRA